MKRYPLAIALVATIFVSCSRDEDATRGGGRHELTVNVQMQNSDWTTRSGGRIDNSLTDNVLGDVQENTHDRTQLLGSVALDEQLEIVAECEPIGSAPETPLTRGSLAGSASDLRSMGLSVYVNSVFKQSLTATNNSGSWNVANNIQLNLDKNKYSYYAYAPAAAAAENGIVLQAEGQKLTYTAPDDISKQPDLCWATPIQNDQTGTVTFAMQHALTAVGIKVRADSVEIQSIKLMQVHTSGTLDLTTGAWTGFGAVKDLTFPLSNNKPATDDKVVNLTPSDGYLMLPPQALSTNSKTLVIVYKYDGETTWTTGTYRLNALTGDSWVAGQKVNYVIQLKAKFTLNLSPSATVLSTSGTYSLSYTTSSPVNKGLKVTCTDNGGWIFNIMSNQANGSGTIKFNYDSNSKAFARRTSFTVTSGFTTKKFEFKQLASFDISLSSATPPGDVYRSGGSYTTNVTTPSGVAWKVATTNNCSVSPTSGSEGTTVTITVPPTTTEREIRVSFSTNIKEEGISERTADWVGKQIKTPDDCFSNTLPGYPNLYVQLRDSGPTNTFFNFANATNSCKSFGGRLPNIEELKVIYTNRVMYNVPHGIYYRSSDPASNGSHKCWHFNPVVNKEVDVSDLDEWCGVRCVKEIK